jgi:hypothetical protein
LRTAGQLSCAANQPGLVPPFSMFGVMKCARDLAQAGSALPQRAAITQSTRALPPSPAPRERRLYKQGSHESWPKQYYMPGSVRSAHRRSQFPASVWAVPSNSAAWQAFFYCKNRLVAPPVRLPLRLSNQASELSCARRSWDARPHLHICPRRFLADRRGRHRVAAVAGRFRQRPACAAALGGRPGAGPA